jgi:hypothetical protein
MPRSQALDEFLDALGMAEQLLTLEREHVSNPPRQEQLASARGLRGGAAILMVAAFEQFLRTVIEEHLGRLTVMPPRVKFDDLPPSMQVTSVFGTLERSMKGLPFQESPPREQRLAEIEIACKMVLSGLVNPQAFTGTGGNPDSNTVTSLFKQMGVPKVFDHIKPMFESRWKTSVAQTFIPDKLDEIVHRRHVVAHTASTLDISRKDLRDALRFLKTLAPILDSQISGHVRKFI